MSQIYGDYKYRITFFFLLGTMFLMFKASIYAFEKLTYLFMNVHEGDRSIV